VGGRGGGGVYYLAGFYVNRFFKKNYFIFNFNVLFEKAYDARADFFGSENRQMSVKW
jgi:hypothetical protein